MKVAEAGSWTSNANAAAQAGEKPQVVASQVGWEISLESLRHRLRCSQCGQKELEVDAVPEPCPRGLSKNPR
jgi:hypothetical protein